MKNEIIIINIEVGKVSKDQIPQFIKHLKDCLKRSFKPEEDCPNFVFVPTIARSKFLTPKILVSQVIIGVA